MKKVSIIIPVYNVVDYLSFCIDSIIRQTYKNTEIIIIDDGSTDGSEKICDEYSSRGIKVVHQENRGLSSARNMGIRLASGDYIAFVDSDDYIHSKMIERMVECAEKKEADIVCCKYTETSKDHMEKELEIKHFDEYIVLSGIEATGRLFDQKGYKFFACNKLFRSDLFNDIHFPEGKCFEDITTIYHLFKKSDRIAYIEDKLYYYRIRATSISHSSFDEKKYDLLYAIKYNLADSERWNKQVFNSVVPGFCIYYLSFINSAIRSGIRLYINEEELKRYIDNHVIDIMLSNGLYLWGKVQLILFYYNSNLYVRVYKTIKSIL